MTSQKEPTSHQGCRDVVTASCSYTRKSSVISRNLLGVLLSCMIYGFHPQCQVNAYHYEPNKSGRTEISSPKMVCLSGTASFSQVHDCPSSPEEAKTYEGVVMDEYGYVHITLDTIQMKKAAGASNVRKLEEEKTEHMESADEEDETEENDPNEEEEEEEEEEDAEDTEDTEEEEDAEDTEETEEVDEEEDAEDTEITVDTEETEDVEDAEDIEDAEKADAEEDLKSGGSATKIKEHAMEADLSNNAVSSVSKESTDETNLAHHLQVFLVNLDEWSSHQFFCCYQYDYPEERPDFVTAEDKLPSMCSIDDPKHVRDNKNNVIAVAKYSHDYRVDIQRVGKDQTVTAPIPIISVKEMNDGRTQQRIVLDTKLHPQKYGRYMLVISNCAAEMSLKPGTLTTFTATIDDIIVRFVSRFGELPLSMMGIIPFYGVMMFLYVMLAVVWWKRSCSSRKNKNTHLLGLQRAIRNLVFMETLFSSVAFSYYLHLNWSHVELDVLYSGTAAALLNWGPWSMFVATVHFLTIFGCQVVVTLATDGTWLIQNYVREDTRKVLYALGAVWVLFFVTYGFASPSVRTSIFLAIFLSWVVFLLFNVRRSIRHLRSLMIGQSTDNVMAIGGALTAKRSMFRRIFAVVAIYPAIFLLGLYWNHKAQADSWNWVGYVLGDVYLFVILLHASIIWLPRPMSSQEFIKYAPLEVSVTANNDLELWEEGVNEDWGDEEIELSQGSKLY